MHSVSLMSSSLDYCWQHTVSTTHTRARTHNTQHHYIRARCMKSDQQMHKSVRRGSVLCWCVFKVIQQNQDCTEGRKLHEQMKEMRQFRSNLNCNGAARNNTLSFLFSASCVWFWYELNMWSSKGHCWLRSPLCNLGVKGQVKDVFARS